MSLPICESCARAFLAAFRAANDQRPEAERETDEQLQARARARAKAAKFGKEWCCPRCTALPTVEAQEVFMKAVYKGFRTSGELSTSTRPSRAAVVVETASVTVVRGHTSTVQRR